DRHLIGLVCETFWRVADGRVESFQGDLDEYAVWLGARTSKSAELSPAPAAPSATARAAAGPAVRPKARADLRASRREKELAKLEERLQGLATELAALEKQLADPGIYAERGPRAGQLADRHAAVRAAHEALEAEWLDLYGQQAAS
ncbi:MAG: ABC transporter ATP-binding protein, partial [Gammaproteobacteria bacterium]|nr:ABC transporter ATP-binding protein [Gammaproteobacteria bacterium]